MRYLLELRSATKVDTGVYRWSFSERNLFRPNTVTIGPCSVTAENDLRNVVLLSNTFRNSDMPHVNRSDSLKPVLTVIYPEMRSTHSPDASSGGGGSSNAELGSDAAIDAIDATGDLLCWVDLANTRVLDQSFQQATGAGFSNAYYIYNRSQNAMLTWTVGYGTGMTLANFPAAGTGTVGLTRTGSWESVLDSTPISTAQLQENFEFHSLFSVLGNSWSYLFDFHTMQILWWGQTLTYYDASGVKQSVPGLTVIPLQDYLLSVRREKLDAANTNFYWRLENLTAGGTVQTATTGSGLAVPPQAPLWRMGHASTHFNHIQSCFFVCNSDPLDTDRSDQLRQWLRNAYNGGTSSSSGQGQSSSTSQWYQLFDSRKTTYSIQPSDFGDVVRSVEIEFENHLGQRFDPKDAVLTIEAK